MTKTHRMTGSPEYRTWQAMNRRCYNRRQINWPRYGGSGVTVCDAWRDSFEAFYAYMGPKPSPTHSIDRIDNSRGYEPGNVRWATKSEQSLNRSGNGRIKWTACLRGHPFTPENTYLRPAGTRMCRVCRRLVRDEMKAQRVAMGLTLEGRDYRKEYARKQERLLVRKFAKRVPAGLLERQLAEQQADDAKE